MENIYNKQNLTFKDIIFLLDNNYDPDKKLLLTLLKTFYNGIYRLNEHELLFIVINKNINKYNITLNEQYLEYAFKIKNYHIIKLFIENQAKVNNFCLLEALKCFIFDNGDFLHLIVKNNLIDFNIYPQYRFILDIINDKSNIKKRISDICFLGDKKLCMYLIKQDINVDKKLKIACRINDKSVIENLGSKNWDYGLYGACEGGHMDLIDYMVKKGAKNFNWALFYACKNGSINVINKILKCGANNWNLGLKGACKNGNIDLMNYIKNFGVNINFGLECACKYGNKNVIDYFIKLGAKNLDNGLYVACKKGYRDIVEYLVNLGAKNWNMGLYGACKGGHKELIELMIKNGADDIKHGIECARENRDMSKILDIISYINLKYKNK
ncbi:MAG: ankyrin repeat domain-containing protein [Candidatus Micrarchaeaceae archaeon]